MEGDNILNDNDYESQNQWRLAREPKSLFVVENDFSVSYWDGFGWKDIKKIFAEDNYAGDSDKCLMN